MNRLEALAKEGRISILMALGAVVEARRAGQAQRDKADTYIRSHPYAETVDELTMVAHIARATSPRGHGTKTSGATSRSSSPRRSTGRFS
jgi:hypothetical protein